MKLIENEYCELKSILTKEIKKEIIAFANTKGGKIYLGVEDNGNIIGIDAVDACLQSLTGMINEGIKPSLLEYTQINIETHNDKNIIVIDILSAPNKPYYLAEKGLKPSGVYLRHGASAIPATDEIIKKMIFENSGLRFEEMVSKNQNLTFNYLNSKFEENNLSLDDSKFKILNLRNDDNQFTNLALLLSDECPYTTKYAQFNGTNKIEFQDRKEFTGSLVKQVDDMFEYFKLFNKTKSKIIGLKRIDVNDYPEYSLREALLNATIHRSYYFESSVMINLYDNKFEVLSMGGLINGITIEEVRKGVSATRNPNLANIFYRLGYVESFGTGIGRIIDSYAKYNIEPNLDATDNTFIISLPNINYEEVEEIEKESNTYYNLSQKEAIINYIEKYGKINRNETEKLLSISKTRAYNILNEMLEENKLDKESLGRNTYYIIKK